MISLLRGVMKTTMRARLSRLQRLRPQSLCRQTLVSDLAESSAQALLDEGDEISEPGEIAGPAEAGTA